MIDFKRVAYKELILWKEDDHRKPLVLRGARQVGKTTMVRQFAKAFDHYIELNLEKLEHLEYIESSKNVQQLADILSLEFKIPSSKWKNTLLFIDEIQESQKAIGFLRLFYEELSALNVIAAGSLLEHSLHQVQHFPVGRINYLYLFPLNFQEFLIATENQQILDRINHIPVDEVTHKVALKLFHTYCIIGGMPEIIANYRQHSDLTRLVPIYESIWNTYKDDISKYAESRTNQKIIRHVMQSASALVDQRVKFQNFGNSNYKSREIGEAFRSLDMAKIIQIIYPCTNTETPALPDQKKSPRLQILDTGILNFDLNIQAQLLTMDDLSSAYKGAIIPHLITQELISLNKGSYQKPKFWVRDKTQSSAEVDLVRVFNGMLIPIEIKSGATGSLRSLHQFIDQSTHHFAIRIYGGVFKIETSKTRKGKTFYLMNLPYYLGTFIDDYLNYFIDIKGCK
ncbi:MAG: AAA family ATPase [Brumimicrobium sp.]